MTPAGSFCHLKNFEALIHKERNALLYSVIITEVSMLPIWSKKHLCEHIIDV